MVSKMYEILFSLFSQETLMRSGAFHVLGNASQMIGWHSCFDDGFFLSDSTRNIPETNLYLITLAIPRPSLRMAFYKERFCKGMYY